MPAVEDIGGVVRDDALLEPVIAQDREALRGLEQRGGHGARTEVVELVLTKSVHADIFLEKSRNAPSAVDSDPMDRRGHVDAKEPFTSPIAQRNHEVPCFWAFGRTSAFGTPAA